MNQVPLLQKRKTHFKQSKNAIKTVLFQDIYNAPDRQKAEQILEDPLAEQELMRHLGDRYGSIEDFFFLNYDFEKILKRVGMGSMSSDTGLVKKDLASEMDEILEKALEDKEI